MCTVHFQSTTLNNPMPLPFTLARRSKVDSPASSDANSSPRRSPQSRLNSPISDDSKTLLQRGRSFTIDDHPKLIAPQRGISLSVIFLTLMAVIYIWYQQIILRAFARLQPSDGRNQIWNNAPPIQTPRHRHQQVIIVVGSPETGFELLEQNLYQWSSVKFLIHDYAYAIPDLSPEIYNATEGFRPLMESIHYKIAGPPRGTSSFSRERMNETEILLEEYRTTFNREWMKNKHVVIGSDAFRELSLDTGGRLIDALINLFPWNDERYFLRGSNADATAIILYRPWRVAHLKSLWAAEVDTSKSEKFSTWLQNSKDSYMREINPLGMAEELHTKGLNVAILDVDYIISNKMSLSHYIACNIMNAPCDSDGHLEDSEDDTKMPTMMRERTKGFDLNEEATERMKSLLEYNDCKFDFLVESRRVKFYPNKLRRKFEFCEIDAAQAYSLENAWTNLLDDIIKK